MHLCSRVRRTPLSSRHIPLLLRSASSSSGPKRDNRNSSSHPSHDHARQVELQRQIAKRLEARSALYIGPNQVSKDPRDTKLGIFYNLAPYAAIWVTLYMGEFWYLSEVVFPFAGSEADQIVQLLNSGTLSQEQEDQLYYNPAVITERIMHGLNPNSPTIEAIQDRSGRIMVALELDEFFRIPTAYILGRVFKKHYLKEDIEIFKVPFFSSSQTVAGGLPQAGDQDTGASDKASPPSDTERSNEGGAPKQ
jgi:hypothetical protein